MAISKSVLTSIAVIVAVGALAAFIFTIPETPPKQAAPAPQLGQIQSGKHRVSGYNPIVESYALVVMAASESGIWAKNGIDPEFIEKQGRTNVAADIKEQVSQGVKMGMNVPSEILLARVNGAPVKIVAGFSGESFAKIYTKADGPVQNAKDLDGKKIGVFNVPGAVQRQVQYVANRLGIKPEIVAAGDLVNQDLRLQQGSIDAYVSSDPAALQQVESGKRKVVLKIADGLPKPWVSFAVWATDDLIEQDSELVKKFVKATLESVQYLKDNPSYAQGLYRKLPGVQSELATLAVSQIDWRPEGKGSGSDLVAAVTNVWNYSRDVGVLPASTAVKVEDTINTKFLP